MTKARVISRLMDANKTAIKGTFINIGPSVTVYNSTDDLPTTGNSTGDKAYVTGTDLLYNWSGSGWYKIALINTFSPHWVTAPDSDYTLLQVADSEIRITVYAIDSDDVPLTYTAVPDSDFTNIASITKDSDNGRTFIIKTDSDAIVNETSGSGEVVFKASDGVNIAVTEATFTVAFAISNIVDNSAETVLLMKAAGNSATNYAITYQNSSDVSTGFTEGGGPEASTFTPYRAGGYSTYFDGSGYLSVGDNSAFELGNSNFTIEMWINTTNEDRYDTLIARTPNSFASGMWTLMLNRASASAGDVAFYFANYSTSTPLVNTSGVDVCDGQWHHIALVRNSSAFTIYVDGVSRGTGTSSATCADINGAYTIGRDGYYGRYYNGYIRDLRYTVGTAVYTAAFTPPTEALVPVANTKLLVCHAPNFIDGSTNGFGITVTNTPATYPFGPYDFSTWADSDIGSVYFDGDNTSIVSASNLTTVVGNYTVEFWVRPWDNLTDQQTIVHFNSGSTQGTNIWYGGASGSNIRVDNGAQAQASFTEEALTLNTWNHVAVTRSSTTTKGYINGRLAGSHTYTPAASNRVRIGAYNTNNYDLKAYVADFRYTPGSVVYTANFTPPTAPLSHITNTEVLMQNKSDVNVYDASGANTFILQANTTSSTTQRKFTTSSAVYFDGTGDRIDVPSSQAMDLATNDFTIEMWVWSDDWSANVANNGLFAKRNDTGSEFKWLAVYVNASRQLVAAATSNGSSWDILNNVTNTTTTLIDDQWNHIALVRNGTDFSSYINGTGTSMGTSSSAVQFPSDDLNIGALGKSGSYIYDLNGYIQDFMITNGLARYTENFTPPAAEFEL